MEQTYTADMDEHLRAYRNHLIAADQKSQEDFDKTLVTLASSSLGVSLVFVREFVGEKEIVSPYYIIAGWLLLASSLGAVLLGFYLSRFALRKAIRQADGGKLHTEKPGGLAAVIVEILNGASGLLLVAGICLVTLFAFNNLLTVPKENQEHVNSSAAQQ